jgi:hypothetical protein
MNWKGFGWKASCPNQHTILEFLEHYARPQGTSVEISDDMTNTQSRHLLNTSLEHDCHTNTYSIIYSLRELALS